MGRGGCSLYVIWLSERPPFLDFGVVEGATLRNFLCQQEPVKSFEFPGG